MATSSSRSPEPPHPSAAHLACSRRLWLGTATTAVAGLALSLSSVRARGQAATGAGADVSALLRRGGCVLMMRHAQTEPGIGDPPGFALGQCATQRNLDARGRAQSALWAQWLQQQGLRPQRLRSSAWCRCVDTAQIAFGPLGLTVEVWEPLNSFFEGRGSREQQTAQLRQELTRLPAPGVGGWQAWVTHQVNISALTGEVPAMGEALVVDRTGKMLARHFLG